MWKILVLTESSSEKGAKRYKQIYFTSSGSGDIQEKLKAEKQGGCVFLLLTVPFSVNTISKGLLATGFCCLNKVNVA